MNTPLALLVSSLILAIAGCAAGEGSDPMAEEMEEGRIDFSRTTEFDGNVLTVDLSSGDRTLKLNTLRDVIATEEFRPPLPEISPAGPGCSV